MDVNTIFRRDDLKTLFDDVPAGTEHVVMSAHGVRTKAERVTQERSNSFDPSTITMWMKGEYVDAGRLTVGNCEAIFQKLKSKVAANCVIWFGGCSMAFNRDFCFKAAKASGCNVVTVGNYLPFRKFPKYMVDLLDSKFNPFIFAPSATNTQSPRRLCERQGTFNLRSLFSGVTTSVLRTYKAMSIPSMPHVTKKTRRAASMRACASAVGLKISHTAFLHLFPAGQWTSTARLFSRSRLPDCATSWSNSRNPAGKSAIIAQ